MTRNQTPGSTAPTPTPLKGDARRRLRALAHGLKPVVRLGQNGLTDAVMKEADIALNDHQLVKIKLNAGDKQARGVQIERLCQALEAECVQSIGHTTTLYRRNDKKPPVGESIAKSVRADSK